MEEIPLVRGRGRPGKPNAKSIRGIWRQIIYPLLIALPEVLPHPMSVSILIYCLLTYEAVA